MKVHFKFILCRFCAIVSFAMFSGCMNGVDNMLNEYNSHFEQQGDPLAEILPGDENFMESSMLLEKYPVANDASLTIVAPKASSYKWSLYKIQKDIKDVYGYSALDVEKVPISLSPYVSDTSQALSFYLPDMLQIETGTYELRLEVMAKGKSYRDAAMLIVYDPFYDYF
ncbi:hypothetical protein [Treponema sp.]|uniref:hypothetical protein n=1 Tax=Treponema sp. TaxID=166 RepID=UPI00298DCDF8|nr:hypothetical protein [Treponema sp.]MCQ2240740.1 hypothetical protein [Treponema sp.]